MELNFKIQNDRLISGSVLEGNSGSRGTYTCKFDILEDVPHMWYCVFKSGDAAYKDVIKNKKCVIPQEVLESSGEILIGCYGIGDYERISTNWLTFSVKEGAYCQANAPSEPTPDIWEELVMNSVPYIGENNNWYIYDKKKKEYVDSGVSSKGDKGDKGDSSIKFFPLKPQIDITIEEPVRYIDIEKINGTSMSYYNFTFAKILIENSQQSESKSTGLQVILNRNPGIWLDVPDTFLYNSRLQHWAGNFNVADGIAMGGSIAVNNKNWKSTALISTNHELFAMIKNVWGVRLKSLVHDIPAGTNIKIWLK